MASNHLTPIERLTRHKAVLDRWLEGYTIRETAADLHLSRKAVENARKAIKHEGADALREGSAEVVVAHVMRLRDIQAECRKAFERSKQPGVKTKRRRVPVIEGTGTSAHAATMLHEESSIEGRDGNVAYLVAEMRAMEDERRVLGIQVDKVALTSPDGQRAYDPDDEEKVRRTMAELMATAVRRQLAAADPNIIDTTAVKAD